MHGLKACRIMRRNSHTLSFLHRLPSPKALAVVYREGPSGGAPFFLFSAFICGFSCFPSFVFHLFPVSSLPLNHPPAPQLCLILYFSFRPVKHIISDSADWQPFEVVTLTARAGAQSQSVRWVMGQRWVQPPEEEHLDVTCTK